MPAPDFIQFTTVQNPVEVAQILDLQAANLGTALSPAAKAAEATGSSHHVVIEHAEYAEVHAFGVI